MAFLLTVKQPRVIGCGGSASFAYNSHKTTSGNSQKETNLQLSPSVGYFLMDHFAAGLVLDFNFSRYKIPVYTQSASHYNFGPFVRYYFLADEKTLNLFVEGYYSFGIYKASNAPEVSNDYQYAVVAGPELFFNSSVGLELTLGYYHNKTIGLDYSNNAFRAGIGFKIHLTK